MSKYRVEWTEYHSAIVEANEPDDAYRKVHDTEEYDQDNSLVDLSTTSVTLVKEQTREK